MKKVINGSIKFLFIASLLLLCAGCDSVPLKDDFDSDGIANDTDNCINTFNPDQIDMDQDGIGDMCQYIAKDTDDDGIDDREDNCPYIYGEYCESKTKDMIESVLYDLAMDDTEGRKPLTAGWLLAQSRIVNRMKELGIKPAGEDGYLQKIYNGLSGREIGANILGIVAPDGMTSKAPLIAIGGHYDHPGKDLFGNAYNGARDNAAGVAAVLAVAQEISHNIKVPVAITIWDGEEKGLLGSKYFVRNPCFDISSLRLFINIDCVGANIFRGLEHVTFIHASESGGPDLSEDVDSAVSSSTIETVDLSYIFAAGRSDHASFDKDIPSICISDRDGKGYHTIHDDIEEVNVHKVVEVVNITAELIYRVLRRPASYPGVYTDSKPIFRDVEELYLLLVGIEEAADANGFDLYNNSRLDSLLEEIAKIRPKDFLSSIDKTVLTRTMDYVMSLSRGLDFIP